MFNSDLINEFSYDQLRKEIDREIAMRKQVYKKQIAADKMSVSESQRKIRMMKSIKANLDKLESYETEGQPLFNQTDADNESS